MGTIKMIGKEYNIEIKETPKGFMEYYFNKDGSPCKISKALVRKAGIFKTIDDVINYNEKIGFKKVSA